MNPEDMHVYVFDTLILQNEDLDAAMMKIDTTNNKYYGKDLCLQSPE